MKIIDRLFMTFMFFGIVNSLSEMPTSAIDIVIGVLLFFGLWQTMVMLGNSIKKKEGN